MPGTTPRPTRDPIGHPARGAESHGLTANDRFKQGFSRWFWIALVIATLAHAGIFVASPTFALATPGDGRLVMELHDIPRIELPPEPEPINRPVAPTMAEVDVDPDFTIPRTTLGDNPPELAPPPARDPGLDAAPFTTMTVRPRLRNEAEVARALIRLYPPLLRDAGVGGTALVWVYIDEEGRVQRTRLDATSGYADLDAAALRVAERMEFTPAYNRDQRVPVWIAIPIRFESQ